MALKSIVVGIFLLLSFGTAGVCATTARPSEDALTVTADFAYQRRGDDSRAASRALALFGARLKAVNLAAKYLTHKGLLEHYDHKQHEIFCLAADEIGVTLLREAYDDEKKIYYVQIRSEITNADFIRAQIKDQAYEKQEAHFSYNEEMEQPVLKAIDPGRELSRAYRYIRKKQWRIALIYLGHLGKKYPGWGDLYLAEAIAFYGINADEKMVGALEKACALGNQEACNELRSFTSGGP